MSEFGRSALEFAHGIARRLWLLAAGVVLAALGVAERVSGGPLPIPGWAAWSVACLLLLLAATWAYHDLRIATNRSTDDGAKQRILDELLLIDWRATDYLLYVVEDGMTTAAWTECGYRLATVLSPDDYAIVRAAYFEIDDFNRNRAYLGAPQEPSSDLIEKVRTAQDVLRLAI